MNPEEIYQKYLFSNKAMQLATQSNDKLWICTVYYVHDSSGKIYWTSGRGRRHSIEIENNPSIAVTIVNDFERKQAVQMSGTARRISVSDSGYPHKIYGAKFGQKDTRLDEVKLDTPTSRAYWVFEPEFIELWDEVNFPDKPKQRVEIS